MRHDTRAGDRQPGTDRQGADAHATDPQGSPREDLRDALGFRFPELSIRLAGRKIDRLGQSHDQQGARDPAPIVVGHDLRLRALRQLRGLRGPGQHLLYIQFEDARGQRARQPGTAWTHRLPVLL